MPNVAETFLLSRFARFAAAALLVFAALALWQETYAAAITSLICAAMIWTRYRAGFARHGTLLLASARVFSLLFLAALTPAILVNAPGLSQWSYVYPLALFALWPLGWAALLVLPYLALVITAGLDPALGPDRHQFVACALLAILLSALFVFLREYKSRQLAPLRRTDELTQAASRDYLSADLHKEIQRSEREGIEMAVLLIGLDIHKGDPLPDDDVRAILPRIGRYLHSQLRDFDSYYRVADLQFLAILPGINTSEATRRAEVLRQGLGSLLTSHDLNLTVSAGVAGLNIGDDAESLQQSAGRALQRAQQQGGNRTQSFSAWSGAEGGSPSGMEASSHD
ncbi:GGDEF domain-containing protein [Marinobacter halodurans]|uniref:diguanylate cyclase n=1 Tax=Marinobacter halodurans TaxID=2528979 RepID=A0ABY1ZPX9_9GAMM|nr:GGDEF domain-containing protein [Marinobacter halodurans]TBW56218.1 GGDEF domain-containing protein [Marinobacter halodurans]